MLTDVDKIDSVFYLNMSVKYLAFIKERAEFLTRNVQMAKREALITKLVTNLNVQMEQKRKLFKIPVWPKEISILMADELISQISNYSGSLLDRLSPRKIKIPVRMRFGVFALRYIRQKYKFEEKKRPNLTFNQ